MDESLHDLELELRRLLAGTNDQRRRVGQTLYHFYRTLVFWREKGLGFAGVTRAWSAGGAAVFDAMAASLRELGEPERDGALRSFLADVLARLAGDLERGDGTTVAFLRWLETRFPALTRMMQEANADSRIYDVELAEMLATLFAHAARAEADALPGLLRAAAESVGA
jgi:hypothetical protein